MPQAPHAPSAIPARTAPTAVATARAARAAACLALAAALAGCDVKTSDRDLVMLDPPAASEKLATRTGMFEQKTVGCWVDPRSAADYSKGHIKGAINLPLALIQEETGARLAGHNLFIVYGDGFQDPLAKASAKRLIEVTRGKEQVYVLEGGIRAWQRDGYSLVTGSLPDGGEPAPAKDADAKPGGFEVREQGVK